MKEENKNWAYGFSWGLLTGCLFMALMFYLQSKGLI